MARDSILSMGILVVVPLCTSLGNGIASCWSHKVSIAMLQWVLLSLCGYIFDVLFFFYKLIVLGQLPALMHSMLGKIATVVVY